MKHKKKWLNGFLVASLCVGTSLSPFAAQGATLDDATRIAWQEAGFIAGDGTAEHWNAPLTRAACCAFINRLYGFTRAENIEPFVM